MYKTVLHEQLKQELQLVRDKRAFNAQNWIQKKCESLNEYMRNAKLSGIVVSVSGGIDSTVTAALASKASLMPNSPIKKILLLQQPIHSTKSIVDRAQLLKTLDNVTLTEIDQTEIFDSLKAVVNKAVGITGKHFADGNLRSYMRTPSGFYVAQLLCQEGYPAIVIGTGNFDEDGYLYYFSKAGDGISDVQLIHDLHKSEVYIVAKAMNLHPDLVGAVPSADLWPGQTDEDEIGWSYDAVELWVETMNNTDAIKAKLCPEALEQYNKMGERLSSIHKKNAHKGQISKGI
ncbi:NH3-dependent_NAD+ synthetase [Hexamita inflata]|uniref:NH3-dependent NAD+ synthetase n=1 Tax=Hexamita inflata TaxID=28002 RepID=A0AA86Q5U4_9EUKA|nr:NH3-dependent NAD+ synthetase [Hexamita inflata]CAI9950133.1 NH3-dependent NAD+ synthetase [Hexamita inflata]